MPGGIGNAGWFGVDVFHGEIGHSIVKSHVGLTTAQKVK
jgi:hypothetical protein